MMKVTMPRQDMVSTDLLKNASNISKEEQWEWCLDTIMNHLKDWKLPMNSLIEMLQQLEQLDTNPNPKWRQWMKSSGKQNPIDQILAFTDWPQKLTCILSTVKVRKTPDGKLSSEEYSKSLINNFADTLMKDLQSHVAQTPEVKSGVKDAYNVIFLRHQETWTKYAWTAPLEQDALTIAITIKEGPKELMNVILANQMPQSELLSKAMDLIQAAQLQVPVSAKVTTKDPNGGKNSFEYAKKTNARPSRKYAPY